MLANSAPRRKGSSGYSPLRHASRGGALGCSRPRRSNLAPPKRPASRARIPRAPRLSLPRSPTGPPCGAAGRSGGAAGSHRALSAPHCLPPHLPPRPTRRCPTRSHRISHRAPRPAQHRCPAALLARPHRSNSSETCRFRCLRVQKTPHAVQYVVLLQNPCCIPGKEPEVSNARSWKRPITCALHELATNFEVASPSS